MIHKTAFLNHVIGKENLLESNKSWVLLGRMDSNQVQFGERFSASISPLFSIKGGEAILDDQYFLFSNTLTEVEIRKITSQTTQRPSKRFFRSLRDYI